MTESVRELIVQYFRDHAGREIQHGPVVDWVSREYLRDHPNPPRDPWRVIRQLHQEGMLKNVRKGVYKYDPDHGDEVQLWDFSPEAKQAALERDSYCCVVCGRGREHGVELVVDHIKPKDRGGDNSIENAQTLCAQHNLLKKNYSATEAGKRYFVKMYQAAVRQGDSKMVKFCIAVFDVYDEFHINRHIPRPNGYDGHQS